MKSLVTISALAVGVASSSASTLFNGWNYAIDSLDDGSGGSTYEQKGIAFRFDTATSKVIFAISGNLPLGGVANGGSIRDRISLGDLFLNFSGNNLTGAADYNDANVIGVRFEASNDSLGQDATLGVYGNLEVEALSSGNNGYGTLQDYVNAGFGRNTNAMGDLQSSTGDVATYLGLGAMQTNIKSGTYLGAVSLVSATDLATAGLDFGHFSASPNGTDVIGFSFDRTLLPKYGTFTAHYFEECINDGNAIQGVNAVPEPASLLVLTVGAVALARRRARR